MTRAFQRTKERPLISTGTQKPKRWPTHGDLTRSVTPCVLEPRKADGLFLILTSLGNPIIENGNIKFAKFSA